MQSDALLRSRARGSDKLDLHDLDQTAFLPPADEKPKRICLLGFSWTASSLLAEIERNRPDLLAEIVVIDFNPVVHEKLKARKVHAVYGDITARDVLHHGAHAGVAARRHDHPRGVENLCVR